MVESRESLRLCDAWVVQPRGIPTRVWERMTGKLVQRCGDATVLSTSRLRALFATTSGILLHKQEVVARSAKVAARPTRDKSTAKIPI
jgi:hypothetical protein